MTEERVPFLEIVSEPLGQGRVRGAMASSLIIKEVIRGQKLERGREHALFFPPLYLTVLFSKICPEE